MADARERVRSRSRRASPAPPATVDAVFAANGGERMQGLVSPAYAAFAEKVFAGFANVALTTRESDVAEALAQAR